MCEQYVARAAEPFRIDEVWPFTERLERFGLAGWGWGAAWVTPDGRLCSHREVSAFRDDAAGAASVGAQETTAVIVHLRRPSRLSTLDLPDAQPFDDPAGRFSFSHNGDLREWREFRPTYLAAGRIHGRADTEVGQRWLEDAWRDDRPASAALAALHARMEGQANLATLEADGTATHYAGNTENPIFTFRLGRIGIASTGIYSLDRSLFRYVAPGATARRLLRPRAAVTLDRNGNPMPTS
jgi:glutamine phosphoribosylpyrophosphate amidotransferase